MVHASERSRSSGKTTSRLRREQYRKKLDGLLKAADEGPFLGLIWATQTLQSGGEDAVRGALCSTMWPDALSAGKSQNSACSG
ncbi:hypothetical protein [Caulobacter sp. Root655]|uniref:hypothetical protein n=1 Tax=Caulobacter sp. Root655 TaxID=1736578 RepID=UPI000AFF0695|nr:hypothetical protein [Caulobacter sp. Root655]